MPKLIAIFYCIVISMLSYKAKSQSNTVTFSYSPIISNNANSVIDSMLKPYSENMNIVMNTVIGFSTKGLYKKQPESALGNFMADCIKEMATQKFEQKIDIGVINFNSLRAIISKGDITIRNIFDLLPNDNLIVVQEVKGNVLQLLLNTIAERGGWPISGLKMQIKNKQAINVFINDAPLDENNHYTIATYDYLANGNNGCDMLKNISIKNKNYLFRDAVIDYIQQLSKNGKSIDWKIDNRISFTN